MKQLMAHAATAVKVTGACPATKNSSQVGDIRTRRVGMGRKWELFREAKQRLEHGVPVEVLIRYVTRKLRTMAAYKGVVRHA
jgi:hypothetical protein